MSEQETAWTLLGESVAVLLPRRRSARSSHLPAGMHHLPGPSLVLAERFIDSPAGPFLSLSFGEPVRVGALLGYFFHTSVVNSPKARRLGRSNWGFPHELGVLTWLSSSGIRGIVWEERGIEIRATVTGRPMPLLIPVRAIQKRSDKPVVVPLKLRALARRSSIEIIVDQDDPFIRIAGQHKGWVLSGMMLRRKHARRPFGVWRAIHIPARAEPGVVSNTSTSSLGKLPY